MRSPSVRLLLSAVAALLCLSVCVHAQLAFPSRVDGYSLGGPLCAPVKLDVFVDLTCIDCANHWKDYLFLLDHYGKNISFTVHTFPLPYHRNGFPLARALHVISESDSSQAREFITFVYSHFDSFTNSATFDQTPAAVLQMLADMVSSQGFMSRAAFLADMQDPASDVATRAGFKYAAYRNVVGTPTIFINDVNAGAAEWSRQKFVQVIDQLLAQRKGNEDATVTASAHAHEELVDSALFAQPSPARGAGCVNGKPTGPRLFVKDARQCPADELACEFLPGQVQCCRKGLYCIPKVGCTC